MHGHIRTGQDGGHGLFSVMSQLMAVADANARIHAHGQITKVCGPLLRRRTRRTAVMPGTCRTTLTTAPVS